ncbi:hypothetical protein FRB90_009945 [Tulasnella sp. 427]|nr:hypothetical protein FRB90_009945 [Tulasnella sp. 427]
MEASDQLSYYSKSETSTVQEEAETLPIVRYKYPIPRYEYPIPRYEYPIPQYAKTVRSLAASFLLVVVAAAGGAYFFSDVIKPVGILAYRVGETVGAVNQVLYSVSGGIDGTLKAVGSGFNHLGDAWCKFVPGPACNYRLPQDKNDSNEDKLSGTSPLAITEELIEGLRKLSQLELDLSFDRRYCRIFTSYPLHWTLT